MEHKQALRIATNLLNDLLPFCERAEIAGSVRRQKPEVKDIEIVVIPKMRKVLDMFGSESGSVSELQEKMPYLLGYWNAYAIKNGEKYKQISLNDHFIKLDLFIVNVDTWGYQFAIRTGPADYSHWLVTQKKYGGALHSYARIENARVIVNGKPIQTREEEEFFDFLDLPTLAPEKRAAPNGFKTK